MSNVAKAMSKTFRDSAINSVRHSGSPLNDTQESIYTRSNSTTGRTTVSANFVRVRWGWLSLSIVVWLMAAFTWISTSIITQRLELPKWRNDILPLLFIYRGDSEESRAHGISSEGFALSAEGIQARLYHEPHRAILS